MPVLHRSGQVKRHCRLPAVKKSRDHGCDLGCERPGTPWSDAVISCTEEGRQITRCTRSNRRVDRRTLDADATRDRTTTAFFFTFHRIRADRSAGARARPAPHYYHAPCGEAGPPAAPRDRATHAHDRRTARRGPRRRGCHHARDPASTRVRNFAIIHAIIHSSPEAMPEACGSASIACSFEFLLKLFIDLESHCTY